MSDLRSRIADEISSIQVGSGYESTTIGITAALEAADALIAAGVVAEEPEWEVEYGVRGDVDSPMSSRDAAEHAIERMAKGPRGYRIIRSLVERRVSPWVPVK